MSWESWIPVITGALGVAGAAASRGGQARQNAREGETAVTLQRDRDTASRYAVQQNAMLQAALMAENAKLNRSRLGMEAPGIRARQAAGGDILKNLQDVSISGVPKHITVPQISGGMRPSLLGPNARRAGGAMSAQALEALLSGSDVPAMPDMNGLVQPMPGQSDLPQANGTDRFLSILATLGALSQAGGAVANQRPRSQPAASPWDTGGSGF